MYSPLVIMILGCSITTLLHLIIHKHESEPSTTPLALHRLHLLLLLPLLLLMTNALQLEEATNHGRSNSSFRSCIGIVVNHKLHQSPQVYVQPRVVKPTEYIIDRIPDSDLDETDDCMPIAAYPFVSDRNAAKLDHNPMSPVPREPVTTIVERLVRKCVL